MKLPLVSRPGLPAAQAPAGATRRALVWLALLVAVAVPVTLGDYALHLAVSGGLMALSAMALTVLSGTAGLPSLGTAAFLGIGGFGAGILATHGQWGLVPAIGVGAAAGALVGALIALLTLRVSGLYLAVGTLALQHVIGLVATDIDIKMTGAAGFLLDAPVVAGIAIDTPLRWWALTVVLLIAVHALLAYLVRGAPGRAWQLLRDHPGAAVALGIPAARSRLGVFALSSALIGAAGAVGAYYLGNVQAGTYTIHLAVAYLTIAALGGPGRLGGAIAASYAIVLLPVALSALLRVAGVDASSRAAGLENIVLGLLLVASLLRARTALLARLQTLRGGRGAN
ncbi:branched-chain amino acid ABC transporter permease [Chitinasiproducens palmae]|uniref:Amino acid/amide ABC transporter membrane protein 2, HAAT family n=1 Tax=Chitinasiproducens palmae TaxID=1770053 RepID=A0A1H2PQ49_9BURK|nr:branched-chain amino acid ABC transporter permease [Chitinasiproducens palmae]SDV48947.1 amino acid/amide ABC transporter membrane protein 2, HAAT family [Chitinasiproducens palmae]